MNVESLLDSFLGNPKLLELPILTELERQQLQTALKMLKSKRGINTIYANAIEILLEGVARQGKKKKK